MSAKRNVSRDGKDLRRSAEERLRSGAATATPAPSPAELVHELQVHQVELELQNEELLRAQGALEEARDRYLELYDFAPIGYLALDGEGRIASINLAGASLLGVDRAELVSRSFDRFVVPDDHARWMDHLRSVREHGAPETCELFVRSVGRGPFPARFTSAGPEPGTVASPNVRCTLVDITERRRAEEERERRIAELMALNQRLEQAQLQLLQADKLAAIGQLAAGVAHEINNPLSYALSNLFLVDGYVQEVIDAQRTDPGRAVAGAGGPSVGSERKEAAERDLEGIRRDLMQSLAESRDGLERVSRVVRDLRTFAHPDSGRLQLTELHEIIEGALRVVAGAQGPSARVIRDYGADGLKLRCRPFQLGQVFVNLLVNAAQANTSTGTITVRTGRDGPEVWAEIQDNGSGIPPEHLGRIFEPFFTTKPVGVGTGLGLSIANSIVRGHDGRIEVRSEVGSGSVFRVILPVGGNAVAEALEEPGARRNLN